MANKKSRALEEFEQFSRDNKDRFDEQTATKEERKGSYQRSYQLAERQVAKNNKTAQRSQVMMQGFHRDAAKQAQSELEYAVRYQQNNANLYSQMGRYAAEMGDVNRYNRAEAGYNQSAGAIDEAVKRYSRVMDDYNEKARKSNPGLYYAGSMSREELQQKANEAKATLDAAEAEYNSAASISSMGYASMAPSYQTDLKLGSSHDQERRDRQAAIDAAEQKRADAQAQLAVFEAALAQRKLWDNTAKYQEYVDAYTKDGQLTPEAKALAEQGKAAYERDNGGKRSTSPYANYGYASMAPSYQTDLRLGSAHDQERRSRQNQDTDSPHYAKTYEERDVDDGYLSEAQKELYYALYARDPEIAREYLTLAQEKAENDYFQRVSDEAGRNVFTQWIGMQGAAVSGLLSGLDPYGEFGQALSKTSEAITRGGAQAWNEVTGTFDEDVPILGGKGLGDLYGLGVSMIESGIVAAASAAAGNYGGAAAKVAEFLGTALMGSSAAASDYRECLDRGMNKDQAATHGLAAGIAEAAFEYISIDKLINQDVTRGLVKNFFIQGGVEASEEVCTSVANRVTDALLARAQGYDTQIEQRVKELLAMGMDRREAERKAEEEWLTEVINDGIGGFLSGGMMTVGNTVGNWNEYRAAMEQNRMEGQMARQSGQTDALRQYAEANDLGWYGQEIDAEAVKSGMEPVQNAETGERIATPSSEARNDSQKQTRQEKRQERQAQREQKRQLREQSKQDRQIGSDTQRVQAHIQEQFSGKSIQEQTALRDQMIEQYGNGIAPAVYEAISVEAAKKATSLKSADEIREARDQAVNETQDLAMKRAIADGYDQAVFGQAMRSGNGDEAGRYFQQLRNTGEGGMTLEATVKDQDGQSRQIAITGMTEDGKGVKLADGTTVAVSKLQADADTMDAIQRISELEMGADADAVLQAYIKADKSGVDGYRWLMDYSLAYEQGRTNKIGLEEAVKRSSLDQRTVMEAYTLGQRNAHQETRSAVEALKAMPKKQGITGKTSNIDTSEIEGVTLNESEREQFEFANKIFSLIGVDVKWKASAVQNGRYVGANGSYLNGVVTLDVHAGRNFLQDVNSGILATTGHELTHFLQQYAPEQYQALKEFLFRQIVQGSANGEVLLERMIWDKQRRASSKLSRKAAEDEVVADACQTMLRDSKAIREFAQHDEEAAKGIARWLDKWLGKLKQAFSRSAQLTEEARFVDSFAKEVREAFGKLWDEALREAVETHDRVGNIGARAIRGIEETGASEQMAEEAIVQNSDRLDEETLRFLDNQEHVTVYRAMQMIDGKLYPPMAAKVEGKLVDATEIGEWYQAVERPDLIDPKTGKWKLDKANGKAIKAAYNPYFHTSATPLNDQFSSAYNRPNIVVVEGIIPKSELTSGYKAQYAKDSVGETKWHAGPVASKLKGAKSRRVFLSRWFQAQRVVSDAEVADVVAKTLEGENIAIPNNVVTPSLLEALRERGVAIDEGAIDRFESKHGMRQNSDRDTEYLEAVENDDMATAQKMVLAAAKKAGYNSPKLYHGSSAFGFTSFNMEKSFGQIFATTSIKTAKTYSGETKLMRLSDQVKLDVDALHGDALLEAANKYLDNRYDKFKLLTDTEKKAGLQKAQNNITKLAQKAAEFRQKRADRFDAELSGIYEKMTDALNRIASAQTEDDYEAAYKQYDDALWDFKWKDGNLFSQYIWDVPSKDVLNAYRDGSDFLYQGDLYRYTDTDGKWAAYLGNGLVFDNQMALELDAELHKGVYQLYGRMGKKLTIDANGANWNAIVTPEELHLDRPSKTRTIAEKAFALGYDSVEIKNVRDNSDGTDWRGISDVYIFNAKNAVKSADPVTYDDSGNVIPLSERFNRENEDIRYSERTRLEGQMGLFGNDQGGAWTEPETMQPIRDDPYKGIVKGYNDLIKQLRQTGKWNGHELDEYFKQADFNFIWQLSNEAIYPNARKNLREFLSHFSDEQALHVMNWLIPNHTSYEGKQYNKAKKIFREEVAKRTAEAVNGRSIELTRGEMETAEVKKLFYELNKDAGVAALAKKVFAVVDKLGPKFYASEDPYTDYDIYRSKPGTGRATRNANGVAFGGDVLYRISYFADPQYSDQHKATTLLHEAIHACTSYAVQLYDKGYNLSDDMKQAVRMLRSLHKEAKQTPGLLLDYGIKSEQEFLAELANPNFRARLKKHNLLDRFVDAICKLFGIERKRAKTQFDAASAVLDYMLRDYDTQAAARFYENADKAAKRWEDKNQRERYSERDYDLPSDLELMDRAIEGLSEAGGEEYWKALLETDPGLAEDVKGYKDQARKLAAAEKRLADYKKQMQLGGNRKLNTRGITSLSLEMMKTLDASDAKGRGVAKQVTQTLTSAYQKALDAIDKGTSDADAWDIVYNEGVVPAAEIIAKQGTHSEKTGRGWITTSLESYYGEGGMQAIIDTMAGYVGADFATNRYRKAIQPTIADRIVERTEKRMQKQVDAATERATEAERINKKLTEDRDFWKNQQAKDSETVTFLNERLKEARQDLRDNKSLSSQERRKLAARIKSLQTQLQAKREEIQALKSLSQQLDKQAVEFGQKQAKLLDKLEQQVQRERDILAGKLKPLGMQRLLKAEREKAEEKIKQHKDQVFRDYKDRQQQAKLRGRIKNLSDDMKRRMTNPSERAYVPASLFGSMTKLCDALDDLLSPGTGTKAEARYRAVMDKIHGLAAEYQAVKDLDDPTYSSEYDEEIQHEINELVKTLNGRTSTTELSTEELQKVYNIMKYINYCMTTAKDLMGSTQFKDVYSAMRSVVNQQQGEKSLKSLSNHEKAKRLRMLDNLSVMRAVEMMSGWDRNAALYQLFHAIEQGTDASWAWVMDYNKSLQDLKTGKNEKAYRKALTEAMDFGITDEEGLKVTMTKMQAIQILMTAEREAHNDKLLHLQTGGAVIRNVEDIQNGKGAKATSQTVKVTPELLQKIQDSLTDWDRAYMKAVRSYFQKEGRRTNEIMYKMKHRVLQTEEYYVPYSVDKNYLETNLDERQAMSMWVKTPGSTNALQQKAKQPVIIDGMDAVMERHVKEIADYIGLALPIRDFSKVYNGMLKTGGDNPLPVKETIDRAFGSKGQHLLTQAVIDVQGGSAKQNWSSGISDFLSGLQSAFVRSALLINPSVTIKQAASYIAAESILSHRALVAGNRATFSSDETKSPALIAYLFANPEGKTAQRIYNEIDKYTSLHYQRRLGMSQAEIANEANRTGKLKRKMNMIGANMEQSKIGHAVRKTGENLNPVTWIQRMDVATTATLWVACKEQAKLDGMKAGTAEFWQRTTELYERCLWETQPMYDGLHRTAHQKQAGGLVQFLFPFRTVPIQNHGQLAASYEALKASRNKSKAEQAEAKRFFAKTVWAQTESAFVFSLMTFLAAALKRKTKKYRDEDEELTALSAGKGLLTDVGSTLFSVLVPMYGSELVNIGSRALDKFQGNSGYTYDAFSVGVVDMLNDLASSFDKIAADFGKLTRGEDVSFGDVGSHGLAMLLKAAKLAGIPADTVRTYYNGIVGNVEDIANGRIPALNDESWERATGVNAKRFYEAWEAGDEAKMQTVLNEVRQSGKSEDSIANAFNSYAKDAYENNGLSLEQYADYLEKTGMFDAEKISGKVKNLVRDEFQAGERSEDEAISALTGICGMDEDAAWKTVQRWEAGAEHEGEEDYSYSQYEDLREALDAGKSLKEAGKEYLDHGYTEEQIAAQAVSWLKDQVTAGKINEDRAIQLLRQYKGMDADKAWKKVQEWKATAAHADDEDYSWSQYDDIDAAIDGNKDIKTLVKQLTSHGVEEKSVTSHVKSYLIQRYEDKAVTESQFRNQLSRYCGIVAKKDVDEIVNNANCYRDSGYHYSELKTAYNAKELSGDKARQMLVKYGGLSKDEAKQKTRFWDFEVQHPDANLSIEKVNAYYDTRPANYGKTMEQAGISVQSYISYCQQASKAQGTDLNHDGRTDSGSKKAAVMRIIDGLNLTRSQKDALYYLNGWSPKTIYEAPWH